MKCRTDRRCSTQLHKLRELRRSFLHFTEFDGRRISVIGHRFASDELAAESFTRLARFGPSLIPVKERERVSGKVQLKVSNQRLENSCLANSLSVKIYTVLRTL